MLHDGHACLHAVLHTGFQTSRLQLRKCCGAFKRATRLCIPQPACSKGTPDSTDVEHNRAAPTACAGFGHLVVCTSSHCHVYSTSNFNTPHIFDLKEQPQLVLQCSRNFALQGAATGLQVCRQAHQGCP